MAKYLSLDENFLDRAEIEVRRRGLHHITIVDTDSHYMQTPWDEVAELVDEPWRQRMRIEARTGMNMPRDLGDRSMDGRMKSYGTWHKRARAAQDPKLPRAVEPIIEACRKMAIDYTINFPTDMLSLGLHPDPEFEAALAFGYARWMTQRVLPNSNLVKTMLYLPFGDADACIELVEKFGDKPGVLGFMITSTRRQPIYSNAYMPLFELLERKGLPLGFHTVSHWADAPFLQLNRFLSAHALGFPFYNMVQMTNIIVNGLPERFPNLKFIFIEAGLAWLPFMIMRLDAEYLHRSADAPLLRHKPSHYIRQFYFTTQPLEVPDNPDHLKMIFDLVGVDQFMYASDYPHHDFDLPTVIWDLPFLSEAEKRKVLGGNAQRLFGDLLTRGNVPGRDY